MKRLPIGIQTFSKLIENNCVYVDKTALIHELITNYEYCFLSRPRRFGKSLLVSTLADIFSGNKELFNGLAISTLPYAWKKQPVIMISFADIPNTTPEVLENGIKLALQRIANEHQIPLREEFSSGQMLQELVVTLSKEARVVLLIDEYDYPILQHIHNPADANAIREVLRSFYSVIKGLDKYFRFGFFTGVSKFAQTSIFSGLNNLYNMTLDAKFNPLLGYTEHEIITNFEPHLIAAAQYNKCSIEELLKKITEWYDGYLFTAEPDATKMYNPYSVLLFLTQKIFSNYWFATGTPTFLINLFKKHTYPIQDFEQVEASRSELDAFDIENISLKTLLFQTGYLTISKQNPKTGYYTLTYPNKETIDSLFEYIFTSMTNKPVSYLGNTIAELLQALENSNFKKLQELLTSFYAAIPYTIKIDAEKYYQTIFYITLKLIGADIIVEQPTNIGRIDAVIQTKNTIFVIEMKINASAESALQQIKNKKYYQPYETLGKHIILVGIAFDTTLNNISEIKHETLQ
jgi:Predicted AAA-ATPase/PD-(D/E)XK nuclease superfamily